MNCFIRKIWFLIGISFLFTIGLAQAKELSKEPFLRIEADMHTAVVKRIGVSADGRVLATGSDDRTVRLWSLPEGRLIRTLRLPVDQGNGGRVYAVALSPDGRRVAVGGWDAAYAVEDNHYVYLLSADSGAVEQRLGPLPSSVHDLAFSPDGRWLAAGLGDNGVRLWDGGSGFSGAGLADTRYGDSVYGLSFSADSRRLAATSYDGKIRLYRLAGPGEAAADLVPRLTSRAPGGKQPFGIAFSPDGQRLAVGYSDSPAVSLLDGETLKPVAGAGVETGFADNGNLGRVAWSEDGSQLFAGGTFRKSGQSQIVMWGGGGLEPPRLLQGAGNTIMDLAAMPGGGIAWAAYDQAFGVIDGQGESLLRKLPVTADMRGKHSGRFASAPDASSVWFGLQEDAKDPWRFEVGRLALTAARNKPAGFLEPNTSRLKIKNWEDDDQPTLNGKALKLEPTEWSRSLAIAADGGSFVLGADWSLRRYDNKGKELWQKPVPGAAWGVNLSADDRLVVAAVGDGTLRWFRARDGEELLALFVHVPDKRWVAWTPTGYYAASPGGEDLIGWHVNRSLDQAPDFFPASRFRERFYRPDIVQLVLTTQDEGEAVKQANQAANIKDAARIKAQLPPVVSILSPGFGSGFSGSEVRISYSVRSPSGLAVDGVEVLIDGRPARGLEPVAGANEPDKDKEYTGEVKVTLPSRDVEVGLIARAGSVSSEVSRLALKWQGGAAGGEDGVLKPKLYGLVVGVSEYARSELKLGFAAKDARDFAAALQGQEGGLYGKVEIRLLTDGEASGDAVLEGLTWLEQQVTSRDVGVLFLAGHGKTDEKKRFYYYAVDTDPGELKATALSRDTINDTLSALPGKVLAFLDTCHSGAVSTGKAARGNADMTEVVNDLAGTDSGVVVFASSTGREISQEDAGWNNGAFTRAVVEGLAGSGDLIRDGKITTSELDAYVVETVKQLTQGGQHPVMIRPSTVPDFPFAIVR